MINNKVTSITQDLLDLGVTLARTVLTDNLDHQARSGQLVTEAHLVPKVNVGSKECQENLVNLVKMARTVKRVCLDSQE
jgi:hypothetical protein